MKKMSSLFVGGVIGFIISVAFYFLIINIILYAAGSREVFFPLSLSGMDLLYVYSGPIYIVGKIICIALITLLGAIIGLIFSSTVSLKVKITTVLITLIVFAPISYYSYSLKRSDAYLIRNNTITIVVNPKTNYFTSWFIPDYGVCEKLSIFNLRLKNDTFGIKSCRNGILLTDGQKVKLGDFVQDPEAEQCMSRTNSNKWICLSEIAIKRRDLSLCEAHPFGPGRDSCVAQIAISKHDASLCPIKLVTSDARPGGYFEGNYTDCIEQIR